MFRNPTTDIIIVLVIVLLFFGPKRLPLLGRELGRGMREFKDSITGDKHSDEEQPALNAAPAEPNAAAAQPDAAAAAPTKIAAQPERAPADSSSESRS